MGSSNRQAGKSSGWNRDLYCEDASNKLCKRVELDTRSWLYKKTLTPAKHTYKVKNVHLFLCRWLSDYWNVTAGDQLSKWQKNHRRQNGGVGGCPGRLLCATEIHEVDIKNSIPGQTDMVPCCIVKYFSLFVCLLFPCAKHFKEILLVW